jgi:hypothetical protein
VTKEVKRLMGRLLEQGFTYQLSRSGRILVFRDHKQVASIPTKAGGHALESYVARLKAVGFNA